MKSQNHEIGDLKMRKAVGIILIRKDGFVWTGKRKLGPGVRSGERNLWQMPQGGIDDGEKPIEAKKLSPDEEIQLAKDIQASNDKVKTLNMDR